MDTRLANGLQSASCSLPVAVLCTTMPLMKLAILPCLLPSSTYISKPHL